MSWGLVKLGDTAHPITVKIKSSTDHVTGVTSILSATLTAAAKVSKNGGVLASAVGNFSEVGNGEYAYHQSIGEVDTPGEWSLSIVGISGADPAREDRQIVAVDVYDAIGFGLQVLPGSPPNQIGGFDASTIVATGTAQAGAASSITLAAGTFGATDLHKGNIVRITLGTGFAQSRVITAYNSSTKVATVSRPWVTVPDNTSAYVIISDPHPALDVNLAVAVGSIANGVISALTFAANALDAVWSTGARALTAFGFSVTVGTNNDKGGYSLTGGEHTNIGADVQNGLTAQGYTSARATKLDALDRAISGVLTTAMTESYAADGAQPNAAQALFLIMQRLADFDIAGTTLTIRKLDGATQAAVLTFDDATTPTSSRRTS